MKLNDQPLTKASLRCILYATGPPTSQSHILQRSSTLYPSFIPTYNTLFFLTLPSYHLPLLLISPSISQLLLSFQAFNHSSSLLCARASAMGKPPTTFLKPFPPRLVPPPPAPPRYTCRYTGKLTNTPRLNGGWICHGRGTDGRRTGNGRGTDEGLEWRYDWVWEMRLGNVMGEHWSEDGRGWIARSLVFADES